MPLDATPIRWQQVRRVVLLSLVEDAPTLACVLEPLCLALPAGALTLLTATPIDYPHSPGWTGEQAIVSAFAPRPLIEWLQPQAFEAAIVLTPPGRSPHTLAYCCYLAGIPIRVGQSLEFGGGVLSSWVRPPLDPLPLTEYCLHLLRSAAILAPTGVHS
jgi:hypothetical protein